MDFWITNLSGLFDGYNFTKGPINIEVSDGKIINITKNKINHKSIDGSGKILSHPFVDGHTHLIFAGNRFNELSQKLNGLTYSQILESGGGIHKTVKQTRDASDEELLHLVMNRLDLMLQQGTLNVEIKTGYGLSTPEEIRLLKIINQANQLHQIDISPTFAAAHVYPKDISPKDYVNEIIDEMIPYVAKHNLATSTDVFCDKGAFTIDDTLTIFDQSQHYKLPIKVHAEEIAYTGIAKIASKKYDMLSADHLLHAKQDDFETLSSNNVVAMFMPTATLGLFTKSYPQGFKNTNVDIGLGTDFNPNNWTTSMQTVIRMAVYLYKLTPINAMKAATIGSYKSIYGRSQEKLTINSKATFILIRSNNLSEFVSKIDQNLITDVYKDGKLLFQKN